MNDELKNRKYDLQERLIQFAILIIKITDSLFDTRVGNHVAGQLVRSGTHPALHYGEAQSAESRQDFIHKLKVLLKELRETNNALKISKKALLFTKMQLVDQAIPECNELISIFVKSISTAEENLRREKSVKNRASSSSIEPSSKKHS